MVALRLRASAGALAAGLAAVLALASGAAADVPTAVHLAMVGDAGKAGGSMMVTWTTKTDAASTVRYGTSPSALTSTGTGESVKFEAGGIKGTNTQYIHSALMGPLDANTVYYYAVGAAGAGSSSATFNYTYKVLDKFAVYGDFGLVNDESLSALLAEAHAGTFDAVIHAGDFAYDLHDDFGTVGDKFMAQIEPMVSHVPMAVAPGNHEEANNFTHFKHRFNGVGTMGSGKTSGSGTTLWYSWDAGLVHFVSIDTEAFVYYQDPAQQARMLDWLEADLKAANANRAQRPWIVAYGHKLYWMVSWNNTEDIFHKYGVDVYLGGHVHNYIRAFPTYKDGGTLNVDTATASDDNHTYTDPKYMVSLVAGSPGCKEKIAKNGGPQGTTVVQDNTYGYGHLWAVNATHMRWQWLQTAAPGLTGTTVRDELMIVVNSHGMRA